MANFALPLSLSAVLVSALTYGVAVGPSTSPGGINTKINSVTSNDHKVWELKNLQTGAVCLVYKTRRVSSASTQVDIDPACQDVFIESAYISVWQEDELGNVSLVDGAGNILAEFSDAPKTGLMSITGDPGNLQLTPNS